MHQIKQLNTKPRWIEWKKINSSQLEVIEHKVPWEVIKMVALEMTNPRLGVKEYTLHSCQSNGRKKIRDFRHLYVIKYPRIWQALFYILKFQDRPFLCEHDTNKLEWKKAKSFLNNDELFIRMSEYWPFGPKE